MTIPLPLLIVCGGLLVSLTVYVLTGGADYGGGVWDLLASGPRATAQRNLIEHAIGPVWEADHVWLILVIVILFNAFPPAFATITIAMHIPITLMLVGIVLRGSAFSFRSYGGGRDRAQRRWGRVFAIASLITPLLLGIIIGAIASGTIPKNPQRIEDFLTPWMTPFCFAVGLFALALFSYLAAVYATMETDDPQLSDDFRLRAIAAGIAVGVISGIVLILAEYDAPGVWAGLTHRVWTWPMMWLNGLLAIAALYALWARFFVIARICAAGHVILIVWGWAFAQFPYVLEPDVDIYTACAPSITLKILAAGLAGGAMILLPSYRYLLKVFKSRPKSSDGGPDGFTPWRRRHLPNLK